MTHVIVPPVLRPGKLAQSRKGIRFSVKDYRDMCKALFESREGRQYIKRVDRLLLKQPVLPLMYMNFKSHNILNDDARRKMFQIIGRYQPTTLCLSEALVPISLAYSTQRKRKTVPVVSLDDIRDDTITQPYRASQNFERKKMAEYGNKAKSVRGVWKHFFIAHGYKYVVFASPADCPFGKNWGNCIITKVKPRRAHAIHLPSHGKRFMGDKESRCAVVVTFDSSTIATVHLDDVNDSNNSRAQQTTKLIKSLRRYDVETLTLCGDMNALNKKSYTATEWAGLTRLAHPPGSRLPVDAVQLLNNSRIFRDKLPVNTGQKFESIFQKCVTHVYSNVYKNSIMYFTDATEFDHQPIFVW